MNIEEHLLLWNYASIKVLDVRHRVMRIGDTLQPYKLPTSVLIVITRGTAQVHLDQTNYHVIQFQMIHSGKGAALEINQITNELECYLIFYKGSVPYPVGQRILQLFEKRNAFQIQFSLVPKYPVTIYEKVQLMHESWQQSWWLERLQVKTLFYQIILSIYQELCSQESYVKETDLVSQIKRYVDEHYADSIRLESLAEHLNYSVSHISAVFKRETNYSFIEYVMHTRMKKAVALLKSTNVSLKDIATSVGYTDVHYFNRIFKRHLGISPGKYRKRVIEQGILEDTPQIIMESSIEGEMFQRYIVNDNHYQYKKGENIPMSQKHKTNFAAIVLLCLTLLLGACSNGTNPQSKTQGQTTEVTQETIVYKAANREVEIPKNPKRIVVVADSYAGYLLALGIKPIGMSDFALSNPYFEGKIDGIESIGDNKSIEKILELKPDLIIAFDGMEGFENFEKIAPTVGIKYGAMSYREQLVEFGKMLNREKEAAQWINNWDEKIADNKSTIQEVVGDQTVSLMGGTDKEVYIYGDHYSRGGEIIYGEFQLNAPTLVQKEALESKEWGVAFSIERLLDYAGDFIFVEDTALAFLKESILWNELPAVKNNKVTILDSDASYFNDPVSLEKQLDIVVEAFNKMHKNE